MAERVYYMRIYNHSGRMCCLVARSLAVVSSILACLLAYDIVALARQRAFSAITPAHVYALRETESVRQRYVRVMIRMHLLVTFLLNVDVYVCSFLRICVRDHIPEELTSRDLHQVSHVVP